MRMHLNFPNHTDKSIVLAYAKKREMDLYEEFNRCQAKISLINQELHDMWNEYVLNWMEK